MYMNCLVDGYTYRVNYKVDDCTSGLCTCSTCKVFYKAFYKDVDI